MITKLSLPRRVVTTDATTTVAAFYTTAVSTALATLNLAIASYYVEAIVQARKLDDPVTGIGGDGGMWIRRGVFKRTGSSGAPVIVTNPPGPTIFNELTIALAGCNANLVAVGTDITVQVTGVAATTINWDVEMNIRKVSA